MINRLVRLFIQDCDNVTDPAVREKYGVLSGAVRALDERYFAVIQVDRAYVETR